MPAEAVDRALRFQMNGRASIANVTTPRPDCRRPMNGRRARAEASEACRAHRDLPKIDRPFGLHRSSYVISLADRHAAAADHGSLARRPAPGPARVGSAGPHDAQVDDLAFQPRSRARAEAVDCRCGLPAADRRASPAHPGEQARPPSGADRRSGCQPTEAARPTCGGRKRVPLATLGPRRDSIPAAEIHCRRRIASTTTRSACSWVALRHRSRRSRGNRRAGENARGRPAASG